MLRILIILAILLFSFQTSKAQKADSYTWVYYLKDNGQLVSTKDSADYYRVITLPNHYASEKGYPVSDYYKNGAIKMTGTFNTNSIDGRPVGLITEFYNSGKVKSTAVYEMANTGGLYNEDFSSYYANGKICCSKKYSNGDGWKLITCYDSTGKVMAENGNGIWLKYDTESQSITGTGAINKGEETGEWHGTLGDSIKYTCSYHKGKIISGTAYDKQGKAYSFTESFTAPLFNGMDISRFIMRYLEYPSYAKENNIQGKVVVSLVIEKNGSISNLKIFRHADKSLDDEVLRLFRTTGVWTPPLLYGIPVQGSVNKPFLVPVSFTLSGDD